MKIIELTDEEFEFILTAVEYQKTVYHLKLSDVVDVGITIKCMIIKKPTIIADTIIKLRNYLKDSH